MKEDRIIRQVTIMVFALQEGVRATSRLFRCSRNTISNWLKQYYQKLNKALEDDNWIEDYYGRTARESCLLTKEQKQRHCNEQECAHWKHCRVK